VDEMERWGMTMVMIQRIRWDVGNPGYIMPYLVQMTSYGRAGLPNWELYLPYLEWYFGLHTKSSAVSVSHDDLPNLL